MSRQWNPYFYNLIEVFFLFFNNLFIYLLIYNYTTYRKKKDTVHYLHYLRPNTTIFARNERKRKKKKKTERKAT